MIINLAKVDFAGGGSGGGGGMNAESSEIIANALNTLYEYLFNGEDSIDARITTLEEANNG